MVCVQVHEDEVVLARVAGQLHAFSALCSHQLAYLEEGELVGHEIFCPLHSGSFDIRTGAAVKRPATNPIRIFAVRVQGEDILVGPATDATR